MGVGREVGVGVEGEREEGVGAGVRRSGVGAGGGREVGVGAEVRRPPSSLTNSLTTQCSPPMRTLCHLVTKTKTWRGSYQTYCYCNDQMVPGLQYLGSRNI